jgi:hypothetical protein
MVKESQSKRFCSCIKKVRKTIKARKGTKESAAIGVCVRSVLQRRGRTLRRFKCGPPRNHVTTQSFPIRRQKGGQCACSGAGQLPFV